MTKNSWTLTVEEDPETGDGILTFPEDFLEQTGWQEGDELVWTDLGNDSWQLTKKAEQEFTTPEEDEAWRELDKQLKEKQNGSR